MPPLSPLSLERLSTCHPDLQRLMTAVNEVVNICVICGHRNEADQNAAFALRASKDQWPHSRHNKIPSLAVDVAPLPMSWANIAAFEALAITVKEVAEKLGIGITWGGDFKHFPDKPHYQLADKP